MFIRSIWNPNAFKYTINNLLDVYRDVIFLIFIWVIVRFLLKFYYKILKKIKENKNDKNNFIKFLYKEFINDKNNFIKFLHKELNYKEFWKNDMNFIKKKDIKEIFLEEKHTFKILKYPVIWSILVSMSRFFISFLFREITWYNEWIIREKLPENELELLWFWTLYSLPFFIIAWCFIWLSFWNKILRNIGIFTYVLWISFIFLGLFLDSWSITNFVSIYLF